METITTKILMLVAASLVSGASFGFGYANNSYVEKVRVDRSGWGMVLFDQPLTGKPAGCIANGHTSHFSFDTNTEAGQGILSLVLTAKAANKRVYAWGTGTCNEWGVAESWNGGWILD
ncbi:MAG: hypothetical protein ACWA5Q_00125 [bacterium]